MPEQDAGAGELQHAEEVLDVIFPAGDEAAGVVEPGKEAFDLPAAASRAQRPAVLRASRGRGDCAAIISMP